MIRRGRERAILHEMVGLVRAIEDGPGDKEWVGRARRMNNVFGAVLLTCVTSTVVTVCVDMAVTGEPFFALWPLVPGLGAWGRRAAAVLSAVAVPHIAVGYLYLFVGLVWFISIATWLHHALALRLVSDPCPEVVGEVVAHHRRLRRLALAMTDLFAGNLAYIHAGSAVNSVLVTMELLAHGLTPATVVLLLTLIANFLQLSYFSQELSDASLRLRGAAYRAAVGGSVRLPDAKALALVALTAGRPPAVSFRGLGRLSLANAGTALRQFYSVINVLGPRFS
ncbi:Odorant receptor 18 [Frankliniella occidentalis]|nr:Odorant receptor 18 [Frankliniella occidentalis]